MARSDEKLLQSIRENFDYAALPGDPLNLLRYSGRDQAALRAADILAVQGVN